MANYEINTPLLRRADQFTIGEYEQLALDDFSMRVINLYSELKNKNSGLYTTGLYKEFEYQNFNKKFYINPKNINYTSTITDVKKKLSEICFPVKFECESGTNTPKEGISSITDIPNWEDLFGKGEFPFIVTRVFRLGNTEYFCYTITR